MLGSYWIYLSAHCVGVALILKFLNFVLPCFVTCYYSCAANFLVYIIVARFTFVYTKRKFLNDRIQSENKAVLVTGCDSGFGNGLARRLDSKGYHVFASCLLPEGEGAKGLKESCSRRLHVLGMDVTRDDSVGDALKYVTENLGSSFLWAVVNNAGVHRGTAIELSSMDDFKLSLEVNSLGVVRVTKAFLPLLRRSKGRLINLSSIFGRISSPDFSAYCMSKYAVVGMSDCLRYELDVWGVSVISVEPELYKTALTDPELVMKCMDESFSTVNAIVKEDYGPKFMNAFKLWVGNNLKITSPKVFQVIDALESAITLEHPDLVYYPCRNTLMRCIEVGFSSLPYRLQCVAVRIILYFWKYPIKEGIGKLN